MRQNVVLADQVGDRLVNVVVPAGTGLGDADLTVLLQTNEVAMPEDVLEDSVVASEPADGNRRLGADAIELGALEEVDVLSGLEQGRRIHVAGERRPGLDLDDPRRNRFPAQVAGDRYAVVPILDEVDTAQVVHLDRRHRLASAHRFVELRPALTHLGLNRKKGGVEVVGPPNRPTDVGDRDVLEAGIALSLEPGGTSHLVEGEQWPGVAAEHRAGVAKERLDAGGLEIGAGANLFHRGASSIRR